MVKSIDFFENKEVVVFGNLDRSAIVNFVTKESYMLAAEVEKARIFFFAASFERLNRNSMAESLTFCIVVINFKKHISTGDMSLYVSEDAKTWAKAHFPIGRENVSHPKKCPFTSSSCHTVCVA